MKKLLLPLRNVAKNKRNIFYFSDHECSLRRHIKFAHTDHANSLQNRCTLCGKSLSTPQRLKSHLRSVHGGSNEEPKTEFNCAYCEKTYGTCMFKCKE